MSEDPRFDPLFSQIDDAIKGLPDVDAPAESWQRIAGELSARRRRQGLIAASITGIALIGGALLVQSRLSSPAPDPITKLERIYTESNQNPEQQAAALEALSDVTHEALEKEPDNAALHDLAYAVDRKRAEVAAAGTTPDTVAYDSLRQQAEAPVGAIARKAPRSTLFNTGVRAFAGAGLSTVIDGLRVVDVLPGSPAAAAGLRADDVLLTGNGVPLRTVDDLVTTAASGVVAVEFRRGTERMSTSLQIRS
jgi:C-terminal processing protease CtpA/Prc